MNPMKRKNTAINMAAAALILLAIFASSVTAATDDGSYGNAISYETYTLPPTAEGRVFEISGENWTYFNKDGEMTGYDNYIIIESAEGFDVLPLIDTPEKISDQAETILRYAGWFGMKFVRSDNLTTIEDDLENVSTEHSSRLILEAHDTDPDLEQPSGIFDQLYFGQGFLLGHDDGSGVVTLMMNDRERFQRSADNRSEIEDAINVVAVQQGYVPRLHLDAMIWAGADRLGLLADALEEGKTVSMEEAAQVHELDIEFQTQTMP